jgi:hypothetical protein
MKGPLFMKRILVLSAYPILYYGWVQHMKNSWVSINLYEIDLE